MIYYYPQLVEACIEFKIYANQIIAKNKGNDVDFFFVFKLFVGQKF